MPRSHAMWVVVDTAAFVPPVAVFTVKHEMVEWLRKQSAIVQNRMRVFRYENAMSNCGGQVYGDGSYPLPEELDMSEVLG